MLLPHPPPLALGGDIAGTKVSLWVPTGLWPTCPWPSSFWLSLVPIGFIGASARPPQGPTLWVGSPVTHVFLKPRSVGWLFPGRLVGGPTGGNHSFLCHCESLEASTIARQGLWP